MLILTSLGGRIEFVHLRYSGQRRLNWLDGLLMAEQVAELRQAVAHHIFRKRLSARKL